MLLGIIITIAAYFLGSVSFSILVGHLFGVDDIRKYGSGNAGSTNVLRTVGKKAALITFILDVLKGVIPVVLSGMICGEYKLYFMLLSGFAAIIGHIFPVFFQFKGGKGVATSFGVVSAVSIYTGIWQLPVLLLAVWLVTVILTRYVSLGSVIVFGAYPFGVAAFADKTNTNEYIFYIVFGVFVALIGIVKHRANIKRLINKTESKIGEKVKK